MVWSCWAVTSCVAPTRGARSDALVHRLGMLAMHCCSSILPADSTAWNGHNVLGESC